jgi:hypothetical protein
MGYSDLHIANVRVVSPGLFGADFETSAVVKTRVIDRRSILAFGEVV